MVQLIDDEDEDNVRTLDVGPFEWVGFNEADMIGKRPGAESHEPVCFLDSGLWYRDSKGYGTMKIFAAPTVVST